MEKKRLPHASETVVFGVLSILLTICCCGPFGVIFSYIGLKYAKKSEAIYNKDPNEYDGYKLIKIGRILSYIGIAIAIIYLVLFIAFYSTVMALMDVHF